MTGILPDTSLQGFEALDEVNPTYSLSRNILSDSHNASQSVKFYILVAVLLTRGLADLFVSSSLQVQSSGFSKGS
jgi:hypothetical protein